jgi:hypothetical protein
MEKVPSAGGTGIGALSWPGGAPQGIVLESASSASDVWDGDGDGVAVVVAVSVAVAVADADALGSAEVVGAGFCESSSGWSGVGGLVGVGPDGSYSDGESSPST